MPPHTRKPSPRPDLRGGRAYSQRARHAPVRAPCSYREVEAGLAPIRCAANTVRCAAPAVPGLGLRFVRSPLGRAVLASLSWHAGRWFPSGGWWELGPCPDSSGPVRLEFSPVISRLPLRFDETRL